MSKSEVLGTSSYLEIAQKNYEEMFGSELPERDRLYGTHLAVEYELLDENGAMVTIDNRAPGRFSDNFYVYRWIDAVGATEAFKEQGAIAAFHDQPMSYTTLGKFNKEKDIDLFLPSEVTTTFDNDNPNFEYDLIDGIEKAKFKYLGDGSDKNSDGLIEDIFSIKANNVVIGAVKSVGQSFEITQKEMVGKGDNKREVWFELISSGGISDVQQLKENWPEGRDVWIVSHGWNGNAENFREIAREVAEADPEAIVLMLNWTNASHTGSDPLAVQRAAGWVQPVAQVMAQNLRDWGLTSSDSQHIKTIGHSLGSFMSSELSYGFISEYNVDSERIGKLIALDSALEIDNPFDNIGLVDLPDEYDLDRFVAGKQRITPFNQVAEHSISFVGSQTLAGNQWHASSAHEAYLVDFIGEPPIHAPALEHAGVRAIIPQIINPNSETSLAFGLFTAQDGKHIGADSSTITFQENIFGSVFNVNFDGFLNVRVSADAEFDVLSFVAKPKGSSVGEESPYVVYGTQGNDEISIPDGKGVSSRYNLFTPGIFYGGDGDDRITSSPNVYTSDEVIDLNANDTLIGGEGNDVLRGGHGDDILIGVNPDHPFPGMGERDELFGGLGADLFVLGGTQGEVYYVDPEPTSQGTQSAFIADFHIDQDSIQVSGTPSDYNVVYFRQMNQQGEWEARFLIEYSPNPESYNIIASGQVLGTSTPDHNSDTSTSKYIEDRIKDRFIYV